VTRIMEIVGVVHDGRPVGEYVKCRVRDCARFM
jgi:hypothetical protein